MSKCYDNPDYDDLGSDIQNAWEQHKPEQHVELINDNIEEFDKAIELFKQETLEEAGEKLYPNRESFLHRFQNIERKAFTEGAKWQMNKQDNFAVGFAEWSVARALGCDTFTINQDELNIYKKYIDTLNGN